jgi:curved DNA-binding protein
MPANNHDWYAILGVPRGATAAEIKSAHRRLARILHPDVNREDRAHERMSLVNRARDVLIDPERRADFDRGSVAPATMTAREPRPYTTPPRIRATGMSSSAPNQGPTL